MLVTSKWKQIEVIVNEFALSRTNRLEIENTIIYNPYGKWLGGTQRQRMNHEEILILKAWNLYTSKRRGLVYTNC